MTAQKIGTAQLTLLLICNIVGAGIFIIQPQLFRSTSTDLTALLAWVFSFFVVLLFGQCYAELACTYPSEGGDVIYLNRAYGPLFGVFYALVSLCVILPSGCALMLGRISCVFDCNNSFFKFLVCLSVGALNVFGGISVFKIQYLLTVLKVSAMIIFGVLALLVFLGAVKVSNEHETAVRASNESTADPVSPPANPNNNMNISGRLTDVENQTSDRTNRNQTRHENIENRTDDSNVWNHGYQLSSNDSGDNVDRNISEPLHESNSVYENNQSRVLSAQYNSSPDLDLLSTREGKPSITTSLCQIAAGSAMVLWTYDGWSSGNFIAHTVRRPYPSFPVAIATASVVVLALYMLMNLAFMYVLPIQKRVSDDIVKAYFDCLDVPEGLRIVLGKCVGLLPSLGTFNGSFIVATSIIENYATQFIEGRNKKDKRILNDDYALKNSGGFTGSNETGESSIQRIHTSQHISSDVGTGNRNHGDIVQSGGFMAVDATVDNRNTFHVSIGENSLNNNMMDQSGDFMTDNVTVDNHSTVQDLYSRHNLNNNFMDQSGDFMTDNVTVDNHSTVQDLYSRHSLNNNFMKQSGDFMTDNVTVDKRNTAHDSFGENSLRNNITDQSSHHMTDNVTVDNRNIGNALIGENSTDFPASKNSTPEYGLNAPQIESTGQFYRSSTGSKRVKPTPTDQGMYSAQNQDESDYTKFSNQSLNGKSDQQIFRIKLFCMAIFSLITFGCTHIKAETILEKLSFMIYLFYGASIGAILILRKKDRERDRPYKVHRINIYVCLGFTAGLGVFNLYRILS